MAIEDAKAAEEEVFKKSRLEKPPDASLVILSMDPWIGQFIQGRSRFIELLVTGKPVAKPLGHSLTPSPLLDVVAVFAYENLPNTLSFSHPHHTGWAFRYRLFGKLRR